MPIRPEIPADHAAIRALTSAAFAGAAHSSGTEAAIVDALRDAGALSLSLVEARADRLAGHVAISPVTITVPDKEDCGSAGVGADGTAAGWFGLGPVSVRPDMQGQGIGTALIREALMRLRAAGAVGCVVLGDPAYYGRFGFAPDPRLRLEGVPPNYFMVLDFGGTRPEGVVRYHAAFSAG